MSRIPAWRAKVVHVDRKRQPVFCNAKLEQTTYGSMAFRFITEDTLSDRRDDRDVPQAFLKELDGLFEQMLVLTQSWEYSSSAYAIKLEG